MATPDRLRFSDISVVLQGALKRTPADNADRAPSIDQVLTSIHAHLPGATVILSTWTGTDVTGLDVDQVIFSDDPGALPPLKTIEPKPNNVNRQITSTRAGLAAVRTRYAVKMRTDTLLTGSGFTRVAAPFEHRRAAFSVFAERLVVLRFYTVNPWVFEAIPFHLGDCFQYGRTEDLRRLWDVDLMSEKDATHFQKHPHRRGVTKDITYFNPRYAVEQHVFLQCIRKSHAVECDSIDDDRPKLRHSGEDFLIDNVVLVELDQASVAIPKHLRLMSCLKESYNCYSHLDWLVLYQRSGGAKLTSAARAQYRWRVVLRFIYVLLKRNALINALLKSKRISRGLLSLVGRGHLVEPTRPRA